jgi:hypothetical protein
MTQSRAPEAWPCLSYEDGKDTLATLHLWLQVVGKIRLALAPMVNHWWQVTLYVTSRGLTTSAIPSGERLFQIDFDFVDHLLEISASDGRNARFALEPMPVSQFYQKLMDALSAMDIDVSIRTTPCEIPNVIRFERDDVHASYDRAYAHRFWKALVQADRVLSIFRGRFIGKVSPVHVFWGAPDLAVTRFSGRVAPPHPGGFPHMADWITREAYSHEVSSAGWWPGGAGMEAMFYSYAYPEPAGFAHAAVSSGAYYHEQLREFVLPYETVRTSNDPDALLLAFLQSTYVAAATLAKWDRSALEH